MRYSVYDKFMDGNYSEGGVIYDKKEYSTGHGKDWGKYKKHHVGKRTDGKRYSDSFEAFHSPEYLSLVLRVKHADDRQPICPE